MTSIAQELQEERQELKKNMSAWQVWALALGCIIGWGCFILPGTSFLPHAGPIAATTGFFLGAALLVFVALSYGIMIENYPVAGGGFVYAYAGFGPVAAFICGWALVLGYVCIIALNGTALALLARFLLPELFTQGYLYTIVGWDIYAGEIMFVCGTLLFFGIVNYRGVAIAGGAQLLMAILLVVGVAVFTGAAFAYPTASIDNLQPFYNPDKTFLAATAGIVALAPWLYVGFDTIPQAAEEFNFPPKKATGLMVVAILMGASCYAFITLGVAIPIPYQELLATEKVWPTGKIALMTMGKAGTYVLSIAVLAAICSGINGFYIATTRLLFGMARANFLPDWFGKVHARSETPHNAVAFTTVLVLIAPWFGREALDWIVSMSAVGTIIAYTFTTMAAYRFIQAHPELPNRMRSKCIAVLGILSALLCLGLLTIPGSPAQISSESWYALLVWTLLGIVFYATKAKAINSTPVADMCYKILGSADKPVFFLKNKQ